MASEQIMSEVIARAVAEATGIAIQTMEEAQVERIPLIRTQDGQSHHEATDI